MPPGVFEAAKADGGANFYAIVAGKLYTDEGPVRRRILPVVRASTNGLLHAHVRAELANNYWQSRFAGMRFHMIAMRQEADIKADTAVSFNQEVMTRLFHEGLNDGQAGPNWMYIPPALSPCDGNYTRSGSFRTAPPIQFAGP